MLKKTSQGLEVSPEQVRYAQVLEKGMLIGLIVLSATFLVYVFGIVKPYIPYDQLPLYWSMNVHDYLHHARIEEGWNWVNMLRYSDFLNFVGIVMLAGTTVVCYVSIIPVYFKKKDTLYAIFSMLEVMILMLAASGLLTGGH